MNTLVPDTINGALLLSLIDFFLSFIIISFIGFVLATLPLLNRLGPGVADQIQHQPPPVLLREPIDMTAEDHVAVISAAVATIVGAHRIVHIEPAHAGGGWLAEGRTAHHSSHDVGHHGSHGRSHPHLPGTNGGGRT